MKTDSFKLQLAAEVLRIRRECQAAGTEGLGFDCLFQHLRFQDMPDVPKGVNAFYFVKQTLREVIAQNPALGRFVIG